MEVRLDRIQVIWLTLGGVVALGLMFALGVVVGRRAALFAKGEGAPPIAQIDADGQTYDKLTFYDKLSSQAEPPKSVAPAHPPAAKREPEAPPTPAAAQSPAAETAADAAVAADAVPAALAVGPAKRGDYTIQVSAYQSKEEAQAYAAKLERKGYKPFIVRGEVQGRGTWYRVRMGSFAQEEEAIQAKRVLARADIPAWVLRAE
ncbi:MAG: SPOR domain-containing protein [Deltaproteobacteria bacterium]|nr:SPOR domain-containing protein [Deltaproteobacteria bacterium]